MREFEVQYTRFDVFLIILEAKGSEKSMKGITWIVLLLLASVVFNGAAFLMYFLGLAQEPGLSIMALFLTVGSGSGIIFLIFIATLVIQWIRMIHSPLMHKKRIRFGEHGIEVCSEGDFREVYPYGVIRYTYRTKRMFHILMNRSTGIKTLLTLPLSLFDGDTEIERFSSFLQKKQEEGRNLAPAAQRTAVDDGSKARFSFSFVQKEEEYLETMTDGYCHMRWTKYGICYRSIYISVIGIVISLMSSYIRLSRKMSFLEIVLVIVVWSVTFPVAIFIVARRKSMRKYAEYLYKKGKKTGKSEVYQSIVFEQSGIRIYSDFGQWPLSYKEISQIVVDKGGMFIYAKGPRFCSMPMWVFESEGEKRELLDYLINQGLSIKEK